jgi:hypothetical protein
MEECGVVTTIRAMGGVGTNVEHVLPVLASVDLRAVLQRERALADRAESGFAVLVFHSNGETKLPASALLQELAQRVRKTDVVGWLDENLCVLLRFASVADAIQLANEIHARLGASAAACTVYGHPPFVLEHESSANDLAVRVIEERDAAPSTSDESPSVGALVEAHEASVSPSP